MQELDCRAGRTLTDITTTLHWRPRMRLAAALILGLMLCGSTTFAAPIPGVVAINHTYEARIRLNGKVSTTQVQASDAGQAKKLVQQQFPGATVLSVKKVD
jgi:hypothetical protein